jgi:hypothetical protein
MSAVVTLSRSIASTKLLQMDAAIAKPDHQHVGDFMRQDVGSTSIQSPESRRAINLDSMPIVGEATASTLSLSAECASPVRWESRDSC